MVISPLANELQIGSRTEEQGVYIHFMDQMLLGFWTEETVDC